jgi:ISXO2-like transposase domain/Transposase zinc-ribbon domain
MSKTPDPKTLVEAIRHFSDPDRTLNTMIELRWPDGVCCPTCGRVDVRFIKTRRMWECKEVHPKKQFSAKIGTIFEDSPLSLDKWFVVIWMIANCKNGISSYEVHRAIGVTQKTAWFMLHRIRLAMQAGSLMKAEGTVEADETFIGGLAKNMHKDRREKAINGTGGVGKTAVMGILERKGMNDTSRVRARIVHSLDRATLQKEVRDVVISGSTVNTDAWASYKGLSNDFQHEVIDQAVEYVRGQVHTNGIENFWSLVKRTVKGTYVSVEPFHLSRYLDEHVFRFNARKGNDADRFRSVLSWVTGIRLTYNELTGYDQETSKA